MGQINPGIWFAITAAVAALFFRRWMLDAMIDGINEIADSFRGGPPSPMHPLPANDGFAGRSRKIEK